MERCLLTYLVSPCPELILKKKNPGILFYFWAPLDPFNIIKGIEDLACVKAYWTLRRNVYKIRVMWQ